MENPPQIRMRAGVIPYVNVDGASEAASLYAEAFGAEELARMPAQDGKKLMHCHLDINGGPMFLADTFAEYGMGLEKSHSFTMHLVVDDVDAWWERAVQAGLEVTSPLKVEFWGDKYGALRDRFGVCWSMSQPAARS